MNTAFKPWKARRNRALDALDNLGASIVSKDAKDNWDNDYYKG